MRYFDMSLFFVNIQLQLWGGGQRYYLKELKYFQMVVFFFNDKFNVNTF